MDIAHAAALARTRAARGKAIERGGESRDLPVIRVGVVHPECAGRRYYPAGGENGYA